MNRYSRHTDDMLVLDQLGPVVKISSDNHTTHLPLYFIETMYWDLRAEFQDLCEDPTDARAVQVTSLTRRGEKKKPGDTSSLLSLIILRLAQEVSAQAPRYREIQKGDEGQ